MARSQRGAAEVRLSRARRRRRGLSGPQLHQLYIEEAGNFPSPAPIFKLFATLRSGAGVPVAVRLTGNPGGPGHQWMKARYIDPAPLGNKVIRDPVTGLERIFIPSQGGQQPVHRRGGLQAAAALGRQSKELVQAWLDGDWSVTLGAFFDCWNTARHVMRPFEIPKDWMRFRSMDWGSASPFCVQWWAVVSDDGRYGGHYLPRGAMVLYREWYGMKPGEPNVGLKLHADEVGKGISTAGKGRGYLLRRARPLGLHRGWRAVDRRAHGHRHATARCGFKRADNTRVRMHGGSPSAAGIRCGRGWSATTTATRCWWCSRPRWISLEPFHSCNTIPTGRKMC